MYCKKCGAELEEGEKFCPKCGASTAEDAPVAPGPSPVGPGVSVTYRDVLTVVLLSVFTCGIYSLYWFYVTAEEINAADTKEEPVMNFILALLLGIVTCSIYLIYWYYKFYKKVDNVTKDNNYVMNILFTYFLSPIVGAAIVQSSLNKVAVKR